MKYVSSRPPKNTHTSQESQNLSNPRWNTYQVPDGSWKEKERRKKRQRSDLNTMKEKKEKQKNGQTLVKCGATHCRHNKNGVCPLKNIELKFEHTIVKYTKKSITFEYAQMLCKNYEIKQGEA